MRDAGSQQTARGMPAPGGRSPSRAARPRSLREWAGLAAGAAFAPISGATAWLRHARMFHPEGVLYRGEISPLVDGAVAARLAGDALVRLSSAWWRGGKEWIDVLGVAIRFRSDSSPSILPGPGDQDLLLATIRTPLTMPFAPATTHWHDFLRNDYYAVSPFFVEGLGRVKFRATTVRTRLPGATRAERLQLAVEAGIASLRLEYRRIGEREWRPLAAIRLLERLDLDQEALRFDPFRAGRGIRPTGFVQFMRPAAYRASQLLRPAGNPRFSPAPK